MQVVLGIDPGSRITGFGVVELLRGELRHKSHGVILLPEKETLPQRLKVLSQSLQQLLQKHQPSVVVVEKIFLGKNADSAFKLGHARGVVLAEAGRQDLPLVEYATRLVKKGITGSGSSDKEQVQFVLRRMLGIEKIARLDASDALALAVFHAQRMTLQKQFMNQGVEL